MTNCRQCRKSFEVVDEDRVFYAKMDVPEPTLCPNCRQRRRFAWRNERTFYKRKCDMCDKGGLSIYDTDAVFPVYCNTCWWGDGWDPLDYGRNFDQSLPFFDQMHRLRSKVPRLAIYLKNSHNSDYCNHCESLKNCYLCVDVAHAEDLYYCNLMAECRDCCDCHQLTKSELCYECQFGDYNYNCIETFYTENCRDSAFLYDCRDCRDCFMCWNLRNKKYVIFNDQKSKEDYERLRQAIDLRLKAVYRKHKADFVSAIQNKVVKRGQILTNCEDCSGNFLYNCKNVNESFEIIGSRDCKYCYINWHLNDCYDTTEAAFNCELQYESHACNRGVNTIGAHISYDIDQVRYVDSCHNVSRVFGCVGVRRKQYCILNKQYSREEYEKLTAEIVTHMRGHGEWGEFFPVNHSPFAYNETTAYERFPLDKEQALELGFRWKEETDQGAGSDNPPADSLSCVECGKNYRIVDPERALYAKLGVPVPEFCSFCRYGKRMEICPKWRLKHDSCSRCGNKMTVSCGENANTRCEECYLQNTY